MKRSPLISEPRAPCIATRVKLWSSVVPSKRSIYLRACCLTAGAAFGSKNLVTSCCAMLSARPIAVLIPVSVDGQGLDVAAGIKRCRQARAAFVTPSHQFPLGATLSASRRLQLLEWAQSAGAWIVEDDYDSEYRYQNMPIASLQGLDHNGRVIYIGTFSKTLFPALRLGYLVIPSDLVDRFAAVRRAMDLFPSHLHQAVLKDFINEGYFARYIRKMRLLYSERRNALVEAIRGEFGSRLEIAGGDAGLHLVVLLPEGLLDQEISMRAARQNLWLWPLSPSYLGKVSRQGFILGFGSTEAAEMPRAVRRLRNVLTQPERSDPQPLQSGYKAILFSGYFTRATFCLRLNSACAALKDALDRVIETGLFFFGISLLVFGIQQFIYTGFLAGLELMPEWIPAHTFFAYLTGIALIAAGVSIVIRMRAHVAAAVMSVLFFLCTLLLHGPRLSAIIHDGGERTRAFETLAMLWRSFDVDRNFIG